MTEQPNETSDAISAERPRVLVFFDYACPFCYLDWPRFLRLRDEFDAELMPCPFELRPELPREGTTLEALGGGHSPKVLEHMMRMAEAGGLCYEEQHVVANSHLALSLGEYARDVSPEAHERTHVAIWQAYYCDGADIADLDVLMRIAADAGLDAEEARRLITEGAYEERLHQFRHLALSLGVAATPSALICNQLMIGTRPYEVLADAVRACMEHAHEHESGLVTEEVGREEEGEPATVRGS